MQMQNELLNYTLFIAVKCKCETSYYTTQMQNKLFYDNLHIASGLQICTDCFGRGGGSRE
jgi:hypothetical protein